MTAEQRTIGRASRQSEMAYASEVTRLLLDLQRQSATGIAHVKIVSKRSMQQCSIVFRDGWVLYAGKAVPTPYRFVTEISRYARIRSLDTVLTFAEQRTSVRGVLQAMVNTGTLSWPEIAAAARQQAIETLSVLLGATGHFWFEPETNAFDLCYQEGNLGFDINALLREAQSFRRTTLGKPPSAPPVLAEVRNEKPIVLCVDDSLIAQASLRRALGSRYCVKTCSDAAAALEILYSRNDIALMLLDVTMPDVDGLSFCRTVRNIERLRGLPIVMLTARDNLVDRARGRLAGATHYLTKPVKAAELNAMVSQYVFA